VRDIVLQERESDLVLGTFGRGVYVIDGLEIVRAYAAAGGDDSPIGEWRALRASAPDNSLNFCGPTGTRHLRPRGIGYHPQCHGRCHI